MATPTRNPRENECVLVFKHALEENEFGYLSDLLKNHFGKDFKDIRISNSRKAVLIVATEVHLWCGIDPDELDGIVVPIRVPLGPIPLGPFPSLLLTQPLLHLRNYNLIVIELPSGVIEIRQSFNQY